MDSGIFRLQQEAARRVRLMEERNRQIANGYMTESQREDSVSPEYTSPEPRQSAESLHTPCSAVAYPTAVSSEEDNDRLLLLLLAVLLTKSGAQIELIVALLYLAM